MRFRKAIAYAYPSSSNAEILDKSKTGAYYVEQSVLREDNTWSPPYIAVGTEGDSFSYPNDPELVALLIDVGGDLCPHSVKHHPDWYPGLAWAVRCNDGKGYLATQGKTIWFQDQPIGWARFTDEDHAAGQGEANHSAIGTRQDHGYTLIPILA